MSATDFAIFLRTLDKKNINIFPSFCTCTIFTLFFFFFLQLCQFAHHLFKSLLRNCLEASHFTFSPFLLLFGFLFEHTPALYRTEEMEYNLQSIAITYWYIYICKYNPVLHVLKWHLYIFIALCVCVRSDQGMCVFLGGYVGIEKHTHWYFSLNCLFVIFPYSIPNYYYFCLLLQFAIMVEHIFQDHSKNWGKMAWKEGWFIWVGVGVHLHKNDFQKKKVLKEGWSSIGYSTPCYLK